MFVVLIISGTSPRCSEITDLNETPTLLFNRPPQVESLQELLCLLSSQRADDPKDPVNLCHQDILFQGAILGFDVGNTNFKPENELFVGFTSEKAMEGQ